MTAYKHISITKILLSEMDAAELVRIYGTKLSLLTKKQRVIFDLLNSGMMVKDIAKHLVLAEITVKVVKAILGVTNLQEMATIGKCSSCNYVKKYV